MRERQTGRTVTPFDRRAVSDVVGYVLVFSLVVAVVGVVSLTGFSSLDGARNAEQTNNAERAFDVLADNVADVYGDGAPSRGTEISLSEATISTAGSVTMNVTARDTATGDRFTLEKTAQPVVWEGNRETELVYAFGATLRDDRSGGLVLDAGPSQYDIDRTVIHVIQTRAPPEQFSGTTIRVRTIGSTSNVLMTERSDKYDELWLNVTTPRADIWQAHLERYPKTDCSVTTLPGDTTETVQCEFSDRESVFVTLTRIDVEIEQ